MADELNLNVIFNRQTFAQPRNIDVSLRDVPHDVCRTIDQLNVAINGIWLCRHGAPGDERSKVDLRPKDVTITVDLSAGPHSAIILTTDLTTAYVHENSAYST